MSKLMSSGLREPREREGKPRNLEGLDRDLQLSDSCQEDSEVEGGGRDLQL